MSSAPSPDDIARDATWLAQALDPAQGQVRVIAMDRESYRAASFLDDRMLQGPVDAQIRPWPEVAGALDDSARRDARWIFHIGHVGSTLLSRLLGELGGVLSVREPRLLRDLALTPADIRETYLAPVAPLMSRTFAADETACVKTTSFVSEIAPQLVPPGERALLIYTDARSYIASILAGENSLKELRLLAGTRSQRSNERNLYLPAQDDAGLAAAAWACEMTAIESAAERMGDRSLDWVHFDRTLGDMPTTLARAAQFFGFSTDGVAEVANGPLMSRYSKATEYEYGADVRRQLIGEASEQYGPAIDAALAMLRSAAEKSPLLARALGRSGEG